MANAKKKSSVEPSARRLEDRSVEVILSDGTVVILRPGTVRDMLSGEDDEVLILSSLVTRWGDLSEVMSTQIESKGFVSAFDLNFLLAVQGQMFGGHDLDKLMLRSKVEDLGEEGMLVTMPYSGVVALRVPDGLDLKRKDAKLPGDAKLPAPLESMRSAIRLVSIIVESWTKPDGTTLDKVTYNDLLESSPEDGLVLLRVVSEHFFRVPEFEI